MNTPQLPYSEHTINAVTLWWNNLSDRQKEFIRQYNKEHIGLWPFPDMTFRIRMYHIQWEYMADWPDSTTLTN